MYACILETGRGFFERVCTPSNATANFRDPPPPSLKRRLVLPYSKFSGQVFARHTITVAIEVVRIARVLLQHLLCFFMGHEASQSTLLTPHSQDWRLQLRQVLHC